MSVVWLELEDNRPVTVLNQIVKEITKKKESSTTRTVYFRQFRQRVLYLRSTKTEEFSFYIIQTKMIM